MDTDKSAFYRQSHISQSYEQLRFGGLSGEWVNRRELSIVASVLPAGGKVLDLGCGTGRLSLHLANLGYEVVGLDSSDEMLKVARSKLGSEKVVWLQGDVLALPLAPASFDAVVALRLAFHFPNPQPILAAATNVIRWGGVVVLDTYNWSPRSLAALGRSTWGPRVYAHRQTVIAQLASALGLRVAGKTECFLFSPYVYRLLPVAVLPVLERLESLVPARLKARVFWQLRLA